MQETQVWSLGWEDPFEKEMTTYSSTLAWMIPWTEETGGLQSMGLTESDTTELKTHLCPACEEREIKAFSNLLLMRGSLSRVWSHVWSEGWVCKVYPHSLIPYDASAVWVLFFYFFWPCYMACGILAAPPGIKRLQWEGGVLPTGLQGKSCSVSLQELYIWDIEGFSIFPLKK